MMMMWVNTLLAYGSGGMASRPFEHHRRQYLSNANRRAKRCIAFLCFLAVTFISLLCLLLRSDKLNPVYVVTPLVTAAYEIAKRDKEDDHAPRETRTATVTLRETEPSESAKLALPGTINTTKSAEAEKKDEYPTAAGNLGNGKVRLSWPADVTLNGIYTTLEDREVVSQIPSSGTVTGVIFFAHGGYQTATKLWPRSDACPNCTGYPEEIQLVEEALGRGFAVVAISRLGEGHHLDSTFPPEKSKDAPGVARALMTWVRLNVNGSLPLHALGVSSGGYFVTSLAHMVEFRSLTVMSSEGVFSALATKLPGGRKFPRTLYVYMPKDNRMERSVRKAMGILRRRAVETCEIRCPEMLMHGAFLSDKIRGLNPNDSHAMFDALRAERLISGSGELLKDGLDIKVLDVAAAAGIATQAWPKKMETYIEKELCLAYGLHATTSENKSEIMDWFEGKKLC